MCAAVYSVQQRIDCCQTHRKVTADSHSTVPALTAFTRVTAFTGLYISRAHKRSSYLHQSPMALVHALD